MSENAPVAEEAARRWRASLPREWRKGSLAHGLTLALVTLALYVAAFLGYYLLPWMLARVACLLLQPLLIGGLFVIGHDAAHNSLTPVGWLNRLLGRIVFLPSLHPYTSWTHAHNTMHHGWTCFKGRQPDFSPFTKAEFDALPCWRRWLEWVYRSPLGVGLAYAADFWLWHILFPARDNRSPYTIWFHFDRLLVLLFFVGQCFAAWALSVHLHGEGWRVWLHAVAGVTVPFGLWIWFMGFVSYSQHTHPLCAWYNDEAEWSFYHVQLKSTTHIVFPWPVEALLNNIMDHAAHHLDPTIPLYNLPQSQKLLEETAPEHAVVVHWTPWEYLRTCAACKLYDFERQCWTDFDGNPTSPLGLPWHLLKARPVPPKKHLGAPYMIADIKPLKPKKAGKPMDPGRQLGIIRFSPCGKVLVGGDFEGCVQRWDSSGDELKPLAPLKGHKGWVQALAFHSDGKLLYTADSWGDLACWAFAEAKLLWKVDAAHEGWVRKLVISPDGKSMATCGRDGRVRVWGTEKGEKVREHDHAKDVLALAFAPDGKSLAFGDLHGQIVRQDAAGKELRRYEAPLMYRLDRIQDVGGVRVLLFDGKGDTLLAGGGQPTTGGFVQATPLLLAFDALSGKVKQTVRIGATNDGYLLDAQWHPSGFVMAVTSGQPGAGKLFFHRPGEAAPFFLAPIPNCHSLAMHPAGKRVLVSATNANSSGNGRNLTKEKKYPGNSSPLHAWQIEA